VSETPAPRTVVIAGFIGILGALLGGIGECALHYSASGYADAATYRFFVEIAPWRLSLGHFLSIFAIPLYFSGYWHLYERLKPAPQWARLTILLLGLYAFTLGDAWLGSRVYLAQLAQARAVAESAGDAATSKLLSTLLAQASFYNENILIGVRAGVLVISILYVVFVLRGQTSYPRWMAVLNPILLVIAAFILYVALPPIGGVFMPVAMNFAHVIFFAASTALTLRAPPAGQ
jgi:hypothetical protein